MNLDQIIACPMCDALHLDQEVQKQSVAQCARCGTVLAAPKSGAMTRIAMLSITALILLMAAGSFPFLSLRVQGFSHQASVLDTILAFATGPMLPLSLATGFLILLVPAARYCALIYTLAPMAIGYRPAPHAATVYIWAERLRPWAMAEIFIIGVAVALVKVSGLARVELGPAFWAFAALLVVTILTDSSICRLTVWKTLKTRSTI